MILNRTHGLKPFFLLKCPFSGWPLVVWIGGLDWWFGFGFESLVLVGNGTPPPHHHRFPPGSGSGSKPARTRRCSTRTATSSSRMELPLAAIPPRGDGSVGRAVCSVEAYDTPNGYGSKLNHQGTAGSLVPFTRVPF